jgi:hypothetical protein
MSRSNLPDAIKFPAPGLVARPSMRRAGGPRLKSSPAAPLTLHFLVALFDKAIAFAIFALGFLLDRLHGGSRLKADAYALAGPKAIRVVPALSRALGATKVTHAAGQNLSR